MGSFWSIFSFASTLMATLEGVIAGLQNGQATQAPPIRTYLFGKHVEVSITLTPLP